MLFSKSMVAKIFACCFSLFILWVIYLANTGADHPFLSVGRSVPYADKLGHFSLFGILTLALNLAFRLRTLPIANLRVYVGSLIVLVFAALEELSQGMISARTLDFGDFVLDLLGITAASMVAFYLGSTRFFSQQEASLS